ncbi:ion channel [Psychrobacter alimentarius]|uniref:ion channel n=1 Tax=Psychrobacter alimentarius TaxID=261164 RepID=UPI003FCF7A53
MSSMKWGGIYVSIVTVFSIIYFFFWLIKPDSFIINSELNVHPFYGMNRFIMEDEKYDYRTGNGIKNISVIKEDIDRYFIDLRLNDRKIKSIESELLKIEADRNKVLEIQENEIYESTQAYKKKKLAPFISKEKYLEEEIAILEKRSSQEVRAKEDLDLVRLESAKQVELAKIKAEKAQQAYMSSDFIMNNLVSFISQNTREKHIELNRRESDAYRERAQLQDRMIESRAILYDKVYRYREIQIDRINIFDFFYFSIGISTTTTFGDIVANDKLVRAIVSFQLIVCIFVIGGFVSSVLEREDKKLSKSEMKKSASS